MKGREQERQVRPIKLSHFEHAGIRYNLRTPLVINVEYRDSRWVLHNETLNLWGHGERKEEALEDLHENFAYLWKEIAEETDAVLDDKAKAMKRSLLDLRVPDVARSGA